MGGVNATHPFHDLDEYVSLPRLTGLALSPDGRRLILSVNQLNVKRTGYDAVLWQLDPTGNLPPQQLTNPAPGEAIVGLHGENLFFTAKREIPAAGDEPPSETTTALWCLPSRGEARVACQRDGGFEFMSTGRETDHVLLGVRMFPGTNNDEEDAAKRTARAKRKINALLHTGAGVRFWDHDIPGEYVRLRIGRVRGTEIVDLRELSGDVGRGIENAQLSDDGQWGAVQWLVAEPQGRFTHILRLYDLASGEVRDLSCAPGAHYEGMVFTRTGTLFSVERDRTCPDRPADCRVVAFDLASGAKSVIAPDWDRWPSVHACTADGATVFVTADDDGERPIFALDTTTGAVRRLTDHGEFSSVSLSPDERTLYALRSALDCPGEVLAIDVDGGVGTVLTSPVSYPTLPGRLERVSTTAIDGARVPGWLVLPEQANAEHPVPLTLWVHGGPLASWNGWSWRWCPWLLASRGQAVLLPDPALSTGYGLSYIERGWSRWGAEPYTDVLTLTDEAESRADIAGGLTTMMGGSFGGYMANWIATHTDRFRAIVSHASLWDLEAFIGTTDFPAYWMDSWRPELLAEHSPKRFAHQIRTPMLVIHGDRDYRVPISEGLSLWWSLVSGFEGEPDELPHQFLYYPEENHWVLSPQHAKVWYETVLEFLAAAREGRRPARPDLL